MLTYTVELKPQKEGGFTVTVPSLPGCISEGETVEEALNNIKDAVEGYLHVLVKNNRKISL
jgi:predicted RNase H-like HicB family nuclease